MLSKGRIARLARRNARRARIECTAPLLLALGVSVPCGILTATGARFMFKWNILPSTGVLIAVTRLTFAVYYTYCGMAERLRAPY